MSKKKNSKINLKYFKAQIPFVEALFFFFLLILLSQNIFILQIKIKKVTKRNFVL